MLYNPIEADGEVGYGVKDKRHNDEDWQLSKDLGDEVGEHAIHLVCLFTEENWTLTLESISGHHERSHESSNCAEEQCTSKILLSFHGVFITVMKGSCRNQCKNNILTNTSLENQRITLDRSFISSAQTLELQWAASTLTRNNFDIVKLELVC